NDSRTRALQEDRYFAGPRGLESAPRSGAEVDLPTEAELEATVSQETGVHVLETIPREGSGVSEIIAQKRVDSRITSRSNPILRNASQLTGPAGEFPVHRPSPHGTVADTGPARNGNDHSIGFSWLGCPMRCTSRRNREVTGHVPLIPLIPPLSP